MVVRLEIYFVVWPWTDLTKFINLLAIVLRKDW